MPNMIDNSLNLVYQTLFVFSSMNENVHMMAGFCVVIVRQLKILPC